MQLTILPNGLRVASRQMPGLETAAVGLYADAGARHEPARLNGIAHLFEHMVFKGAGGRDTRVLAEVIEDVGGSLNAWTGRDQTVFHGRALARDLPLVAELIANLVRSPHFEQEHLEREKQVILSELGESTDAPDDLVHDHLFEAAFEGQPIGRPVLGSEVSIRAVTRQDCCNWLGRQFVPSRLVLAASGRIDAAELLTLAERLFGDMQPNDAPPVDPAHFTGGARNDARSFEQAHWCLAFPGLPASDPRQPALGLFVQALGGGTSSRLFQELREERGLAYSIYAWSQAFDDAGLVGIGCAAERRQASESVRLARQVLEATAEGLTDAELSRARAQAEAGLLMGLEAASGRADQMARSIEVFGRILSMDELLSQVRGVTLEDARAAGRALVGGALAVASVGAKLALAA